MTVVLGNGWPGILLHEAIGHGLEGDFNRKGTSAFSGRVGKRVAAKGVTVVDDGTLEQRRGSLNIDDEGNPTQRTVLIEDGILQGYMQDRLNSGLMSVAPTGNGRRESFAHLPMPRMTNTMMLAGDRDPAEIIASVKDGLYAANFGGGQVDITSGKFVFSAAEAWMIEDGKLTYPVKGATLIGNGPEALTAVSMIGNDLALDAGVGTCGKDGQSVPVGVGQPTLRIDGLTVGGTALRIGRSRCAVQRAARRRHRDCGHRRRVMAHHPPARRRAHEDVGGHRRAARGAVGRGHVLDRALHREAHRLQHDDLLEPERELARRRRTAAPTRCARRRSRPGARRPDARTRCPRRRPRPPSSRRCPAPRTPGRTRAPRPAARCRSASCGPWPWSVSSSVATADRAGCRRAARVRARL